LHSTRSATRNNCAPRGPPSTGVAESISLRNFGLSNFKGGRQGVLIHVRSLSGSSTRVEDEHVGEVSDQFVEQAKQTGQEALDRGRDIAQEALQTAKDTVQEQGQEQTQEMASSLRQQAQQAGAPS
jgi:polyhydroxyalkanoate synthesis regulator phasin